MKVSSTDYHANASQPSFSLLDKRVTFQCYKVLYKETTVGLLGVAEASHNRPVSSCDQINYGHYFLN